MQQQYLPPKFAINLENNRIVAISDIPVHGVKKGDVGGKILRNSMEFDPDILKDYYDNAWIDRDATAIDSKMSGNSRLSGNVEIRRTIMKDNSLVTSQNFKEDVVENAKVVVDQCELSENSMVSTASNIHGLALSGNEHACLESIKGFGIVTMNDIKKVHYTLSGKDDFRELYQIQALYDIPAFGVKAGDLGGCIDSKFNLVRGEVIPTIGKNSWIEEGVIMVNSAIKENTLIKSGTDLYQTCISSNIILSGSMEYHNSLITGYGSIAVIPRLQKNGKINKIGSLNIPISKYFSIIQLDQSEKAKKAFYDELRSYRDLSINNFMR